ncbi:MAG: universal stress protein [Hyphomicrobiales bacterium]|nr:universal stress protein [Hyphomicrobiales bacterium]MCP5073554.1 universal stress protein [Paracoccaceae bacterium]
MTDRYIVGFDGTEQSRRALDYASARAKKSGAHVHLVLVIEWSPYSFHTPEELNERHRRREQELERATTVVQPVADELNKAGVKTTCEVRHGNAAELLCEIATNKNATQIIIGRTGDSVFTQRLLGGLTITLAQVAPIPMTIVP